MYLRLEGPSRQTQAFQHDPRPVLPLQGGRHLAGLEVLERELVTSRCSSWQNVVLWYF